jgi:hypothetical protein
LTNYIDEILSFLSDGNWHTIAEISKKVENVPYEKLDDIIHFLNKNGFVELGEDLMKVKIKTDVKEVISGEESSTLDAELEASKPKLMLAVIRGRFKGIQNTGEEIVFSGQDIELEEVKKFDEKATTAGTTNNNKKEELVELDEILTVVRYLLDNEWHRYDEITSKLGITTETLLAAIKILKGEDLVVVHDKFGMLRLRQGIKIQH